MRSNHIATSQIGTLSFPVGGEPCRPLNNNTLIITQTIQSRQPALLLCAGWSVPTEEHLQSIIEATQSAQTVVILETTSPTPIYYRVVNGRKLPLGRQFFSIREDTEDESCLQALTAELNDRKFTMFQRSTLVLNCGEVMVIQGRDQVEFAPLVPQALRNAVLTPNVMILNPTHTRMKNDGSVKAWRSFLSHEQRVYVSASNWDINNGQTQSETLHSVWYNGAAVSPIFSIENERMCYREWDIGFGQVRES